MLPSAGREAPVLTGFTALLVLAGFIFLFQLGKLPLYDYDEAQYAQVVETTLDSQNHLSLNRLGSPWFVKPPLLIWLTMGSVAVLGENEFAFRLPTALFGIAAVAGTYLLTYLLTRSYVTAFGAGFILLSSGIFPASARQFRMDAPLAAAIIFSIYCFIKGWQKSVWYLGFWVSLAAGLLIKSVPAIFAFPIALIFAWIYQRWDWLKNKYFWAGVLLFLAVLLPWHIYQSFQFGGAFWKEYLGFHVIQRAMKNVLGGNVSNWDYFKHLVILNEPWFLMSLGMGIVLMVRRKAMQASYRAAAAAFIVAALITAAFMLARTKLIFYLIPMFPFQAVAIAASALFLADSFYWKSHKSLFVVFSAVMLVLGLVSTSLQLFYYRAPYAYAFADDERNIGAIIRQYAAGHRIYSFDWRAYDTMYYYGKFMGMELVERERLQQGFPPPYFLVMPRVYLKNENQPGLTLRYKGPYLVLLEAGWSPK